MRRVDRTRSNALVDKISNRASDDTLTSIYAALEKFEQAFDSAIEQGEDMERRLRARSEQLELASLVSQLYKGAEHRRPWAPRRLTRRAPLGDYDALLRAYKDAQYEGVVQSTQVLRREGGMEATSWLDAFEEEDPHEEARLGNGGLDGDDDVSLMVSSEVPADVDSHDLLGHSDADVVMDTVGLDQDSISLS